MVTSGEELKELVEITKEGVTLVLDEVRRRIHPRSFRFF
jgi:hypothetical protein